MGDVRYQFLGVADLPARRLTWCKQDPAPSPTLKVTLKPALPGLSTSPDRVVIALGSLTAGAPQEG